MSKKKKTCKLSKYDKLWIKAMNSCFDHEGKIIPYFWLTNKK